MSAKQVTTTTTTTTRRKKDKKKKKGQTVKDAYVAKAKSKGRKRCPTCGRPL